MAEHDLEDEVGQMMAEQEAAIDPRLEDYARGALSAAEREALEADAARDPELARALELFAPLSPSVLEPAAAVPGPAPVVSLPRAGARARAALGVLLAAAAAVIAIVSIPEAATPPLPEYTWSGQAGDARWRGDDTAPRAHRLRADSTLELSLAPATPVEGALESRLFVEHEGRTTIRAVPAERSPDGAVRWRGVARDLIGVESGVVRVVMVIGRPGELPELMPIDSAVRSARHRGAHMALEIEPAPH